MEVETYNLNHRRLSLPDLDVKMDPTSSDFLNFQPDLESDAQFPSDAPITSASRTQTNFDDFNESSQALLNSSFVLDPPFSSHQQQMVSSSSQLGSNNSISSSSSSHFSSQAVPQRSVQDIGVMQKQSQQINYAESNAQIDAVLKALLAAINPNTQQQLLQSNISASLQRAFAAKMMEEQRQKLMLFQQQQRMVEQQLYGVPSSSRMDPGAFECISNTGSISHNDQSRTNFMADGMEAFAVAGPAELPRNGVRQDQQHTSHTSRTNDFSMPASAMSDAQLLASCFQLGQSQPTSQSQQRLTVSAEEQQYLDSLPSQVTPTLFPSSTSAHMINANTRNSFSLGASNQPIANLSDMSILSSASPALFTTSAAHQSDSESDHVMLEADLLGNESDESKPKKRDRSVKNMRPEKLRRVRELGRIAARKTRARRKAKLAELETENYKLESRRRGLMKTQELMAEKIRKLQQEVFTASQNPEHLLSKFLSRRGK